ncbi:hypothetical protein ACS0TY_015396 [Phlomoides rotata]
MKWARNLKKTQLGGVIFGCTNSTMQECLSSQLFGLPAQHILYVQNIEPGLPLFLFNYSDKKLHGIFEAASSGKLNIDPYAWTNGGSEKTQFPAQIQVRVRLQCQALPENQFKQIIIDNYYTKNHFRFELDHVQSAKLISTFSSLAVGPGSWLPRGPKKPKNDNIEEIGPSDPTCSNSDIANADDSIGTSADSELKEASPCNQLQQSDEKDIIYMKLRELALSHASSDGNILECVEFAAADGSNSVLETHGNATITSGKGKDKSSSSSLHDPAFISELCGEIEELKAFKQEHTLKVASLGKKLVEAKRQIYQLENRCMRLESTSGEKAWESLELNLSLDQSIFLVGGYDGVSWSSALNCFSPSHDVLRSLKPMSSVRAHASVAKLGGELYVMGGASDSVWCDRVESYNGVKNQWTLCPSLNKERGSLGAAALDGKLFAVGGGNGSACFSDVEMFDTNIGRWIPGRSMMQKRFSHAAVECHGVIYAVGGYDGNNYLKSAERFDPRQHSWTSIRDMDTKRGCHSLVVLNDKLYAIGGYDGANMVSSVEIYDPRLGTWMTGEAMNQGRGYSAAALLNDSIFVIGGVVDSDSDITDSIECYKEGRGWQAMNSRAVGRQCYASAIVL